MFLVGLTGGIAAGKSVVADRLVTRHGARLIDADVIAREVVLPGTPTWQRIVEHFGEDVLGPDDFIDRPRLGAIVFSDPAQRAVLNELTHPPILRGIADQLEEYKDDDGLVVVDIALLVEMNAHLGFDAIVTVATEPETQEQRLTELRGMEPQEARDRIGAQAPLAEKLAVATHVIRNDGSEEALRQATDEVAADLQRLARLKAGA